MKQVIIVRGDLKMPKGKMCVQVAHASVDAVLKSDKINVEKWRRDGMKKVVLKVKDRKELLEYLKRAKSLKLKTALITDAGRTFFGTRTTTCCAIGPGDEKQIDKVTGNLKMI